MIRLKRAGHQGHCCLAYLVIAALAGSVSIGVAFLIKLLLNWLGHMF